MTIDKVINILYLDITDLDDAGIDVMCKTLEQGRENSSFLDQKKYHCHLAGRWLTLNHLKEKGLSGISMGKIDTGKFGKPHIPFGVFFNISHSYNLIVTAVTTEGEIGIDLEYLRKVKWRQYQESFSAEDWASISGAKDPDRTFLEFWTKKESLVKADGRGLQIPLSSVIVNTDQGRVGTEKRIWYFKQVPLEGYLCHVCAEFPIGRIILEKVTMPANNA